MNITFVLPHAGLTGGIRVLAIYAERLQKRGHQVFVVSQPLPPLGLKQRLRNWLKPGSKVQRQTASHFDRLSVPHTVLERCRPVMDNDLPDADVVIATWWETAAWVAELSPAKGAKVYFIQHYEVFPYLPVERVKASYRLPLYKIVIAEWLKEIMAKDYGDSQVSIVANSVDLATFHAPERSRQTQPTVGFVYSTLAWKGSDIILKAFQLAQAQLPTLRGLAFGEFDPPLETPFPPGIDYDKSPKQERVRDIYASCDAWLFGSRFEGFGLPILEAMACRTPVIATPAGAAPEFVQPGGGILVKPDDPTSMAEAIVQFFQMPEAAWQAMSATAYQTVKRYSWEDETTLFETALQTAIDVQAH